MKRSPVQVAYPELQKRKMERARHRQWRHDAVRAMQRAEQARDGMCLQTSGIVGIHDELAVRKPRQDAVRGSRARPGDVTARGIGQGCDPTQSGE